MIQFKDIKNGIFIIKNKDLVLGIEIKENEIWAIRHHLIEKTTTSNVYQNNCLYKSDQSTLINDPKQQTVFLNQVQKVLSSAPYWSIISVSNDIDQELANTYQNKALIEPKQTKLGQLSTLISRSDIFKQQLFYKDPDSCTTLVDKLMQTIQFNNDTSTEQVPQTISVDQFQTVANTSLESKAINDASKESQKTYDFSKVKEVYVKLIKDIGEGKPALKITSKNKSLDYEYLKLVNTEKLIFIKFTDYSKKEYELDFNDGTISVNQQLSSNESDKKTLSKLISQAGIDLEKNLATVEAVNDLEVG